jgi:hypothetical protein
LPGSFRPRSLGNRGANEDLAGPRRSG